jgi:putative membrane protein
MIGMDNRQKPVQQSQSKPISDVVGTYKKLGRKTFWIFVFERMQAPIAFLLMAVLFFALRGASFLKAMPFGNADNYMTIAAWSALGFCVLIFLFVFLVSWLIYENYMFSLGEDALKIKRGVFTREEIAIPYRQIQNVDIEQDLSYRMIGVSRLVILTAGHEDEKMADDETEGVLPAIDSTLAEQLQSQLLARANVQTVVEGQKPAA